MMGYYYGHGMEGLGHGADVGIFGLFFLVLFLALMVGAIIAVARGYSGRGCGSWIRLDEKGHKGNGAMNILKERYAKGEINKEDFEKMKKDLE